MMNHTAFLVLLKYPQAGHVKTRLGREIGMENSCRFYRGMAELCLQRYESVGNTDCTIYFTPPEEEWHFRHWLGEERKYLAQPEGDLGKRLERGFERLFEQYNRIVAVGTDSPDVPIAYLNDAVESLNDNDLVIGPTEDGGYYAIGLAKPLPFLFHDIPWSSANVFEETLKKAESRKISLKILPAWYDVDTPADLKRLADSPEPAIRDYLDRQTFLSRFINKTNS